MGQRVCNNSPGALDAPLAGAAVYRVVRSADLWLLGFVMDDISTWPGPDYTEIEERLLDSDLVETEERLEDEIADVQREISRLGARLQIDSDPRVEARQ